AVTKQDLAGPDRTAQVVEQVTSRLAGTSLDGVPVVAVDGVSGRGVDVLRDVLVQRLRQVDPAPDRRRARLWIDRSFTIGGAGTVVTGTLAGGRLRVGDEVGLLPSRKRARIRGLHALGVRVEVAPPGSRVAVNLAGIDHDEVGRGDALVVVDAGDPTEAWLTSDTLDTVVRVLPGHDVDRPGAWHLHVGSAETTCTVHPLLGEPLTAGTEGYVRLVLGRALPLRSGDRFVLREAGRRATVAGGQVLDPLPPGRVRGPDARLARAVELDAIRAAPVGVDRVGALVAAWSGARPRAQALAAADVPLDTPLPQGLARVGDWLVTDAALGHWREVVLAAAGAHHLDEPASPGPDRVRLAAAALEAQAPRTLAAELPDHLVAEGVLRRHGSSYALPDHAPAQEEARAAGVEELLARLAAEPFSPPDLRATARQLGVTFPELQQLQQSGRVVRAGDIGFARSAVDRAVDRLRALQDQVGPFTASQARACLGTSRKYAIPLLEYLDGAGITTFDGQHRTMT
ncbi:MAG TPA: SelB C-terminal domain-containing protein, partial [Nitriliruptorales bacterium]